MARAPLSVRLPEHIEEEIRAIFYSLGIGASAGLRMIVEEWLVLTRFPSLEFRDTPFGRRAAIRGGPEVSKIVPVWERAEEPEEVEKHFPWVDPDLLDEAGHYYERYPSAIDDLLEENARVASREKPEVRDPLGFSRKTVE